MISCKNLLGELINFKYSTISTNIYIYIYIFFFMYVKLLIKRVDRVVAGWKFFNP